LHYIYVIFNASVFFAFAQKKSASQFVQIHYFLAFFFVGLLGTLLAGAGLAGLGAGASFTALGGSWAGAGLAFGTGAGAGAGLAGLGAGLAFGAGAGAGASSGATVLFFSSFLKSHVFFHFFPILLSP
jgi:hypothetical protein